MRSNDDPITITDPALLREIERVNLEEYECKLSVEYRIGEDVRYSHGYSLSEELCSVLPNAMITQPGPLATYANSAEHRA